MGEAEERQSPARCGGGGKANTQESNPAHRGVRGHVSRPADPPGGPEPLTGVCEEAQLRVSVLKRSANSVTPVPLKVGSNSPHPKWQPASVTCF